MPSATTDHRATLTPQMLEYDAKFSDAGEIRWLPYLMYFHPPSHTSAVVNTDSLGFRYATHERGRIAVADSRDHDAVSVLAGSSTVFGMGATSDAATIASRLNHYSGGDSAPWLNFGGRSHNSVQEILLYALNKHRLPRTEQIVLFSGFNDLGLARLPASRRLESGAFFMCNDFFERMGGSGNGQVRGLSRLRRLRAGDDEQADEDTILDLDAQIAYAADLVLRHLDLWRALATDVGAKLTFVLQPLAGWVREVGTTEEEALFAQLDELGRFSDMYGDIAQVPVGREYASQLRTGCERMGVDFVDISPKLAAAIDPTDWIFVDRIHFNDFGYDLVAKLLLDELRA
jgi:hypothetical protein